MTITVLKKASRTFKVGCRKCGTSFSYELEDIKHNYVKGGEGVWCPSCGEWTRHPTQI